jgi:hypothetical protein
MSGIKEKQAETDRIKANAAMIRANKQQAEFEASQGGGGFFRPEATMQMASLNSGIMPGTTGGIGGAGAVVAPVDFGAPSGIQSQFAHRQAVPAGGAGIEATTYEPLEDLHSMSKEIEDEYHQGVVDINSLSQMAASAGFDITKPNILDPRQDELHKRYKTMLFKLQSLGNDLKNSHEVAKYAMEHRDDVAYGSEYNGGNFARYGAAVGTNVEDSVTEFNKRTEILDDAAAVDVAMGQYNRLYSDLNRAIENTDNQYEKERLIRSRDALEKPKYDNTENRKIANEEEETRLKKNAQKKTNQEATAMVERVSDSFDPANFKEKTLDDGSKVMYNDRYNGIEFGGGHIKGVVMSGYDDLTAEQRKTIYAAAAIKRKDEKKKANGETVKHTEEESKVLNAYKEIPEPKYTLHYTKKEGEKVKPKTKSITPAGLLEAVVSGMKNTGINLSDADEVASINTGWLDSKGEVSWKNVVGADSYERDRYRALISEYKTAPTERRRILYKFMKDNPSTDVWREGLVVDMLMSDYGTKKKDGTRAVTAKELHFGKVPGLEHLGTVYLQNNYDDGQYTITDDKGDPVEIPEFNEEGQIINNKEIDDVSSEYIMNVLDRYKVLENDPEYIELGKMVKETAQKIRQDEATPHDARYQKGLLGNQGANTSLDGSEAQVNEEGKIIMKTVNRKSK